MKIETKYQIGDRVVFEVNGDFVMSTIDRINIDIVASDVAPRVYYNTRFDVDAKMMRMEEELFCNFEKCEENFSADKDERWR